MNFNSGLTSTKERANMLELLATIIVVGLAFKAFALLICIIFDIK